MKRARVDDNQMDVWACADCGVTRRWTVHASRVKRCVACSQKNVGQINANSYKARRKRLADDLGKHIAAGATLTEAAARIGVSKSRACTVCKEFGIVIRHRLKKFCQECGEEFVSSPSQKRRFCSYECHLRSGGARRAGEAAAMAKLKYGAKKDANHNEVFDAIKTFTAVRDLSGLGKGCPDGIAWVNGGWQLFDVKNPNTGYGKRGLNKRQKEWADDWRGGPVFLIYSVEEAIKFAKGEWQDLKREGGVDDLASDRWRSIGEIAREMTRGTVE